MKMERRFQIGSYSLTPYVWVQNLLDTENIYAVYEGTGEANTSGYLESAEGQSRAANPTTGEEFAYRYDFAQNNPKNYGIPRMILLGLTTTKKITLQNLQVMMRKNMKMTMLMKVSESKINLSGEFTI